MSKKMNKFAKDELTSYHLEIIEKAFSSDTGIEDDEPDPLLQDIYERIMSENELS